MSVIMFCTGRVPERRRKKAQFKRGSCLNAVRTVRNLMSYNCRAEEGRLVRVADAFVEGIGPPG